MGFGDFEGSAEVVADEGSITICFETEAMEDVGGRIATDFSGRIAGYSGLRIREGWCKAAGVFLQAQYESSLNTSRLSFDFGLVAPGTYILSCIADSKTIVLRQIRVDCGALPFDVAYEK